MKKINIFVVVLLAFSLIFPPSVMAEVVGSVTCIEGRVDKRAIGESDYLPVVVGDEISIGDALRTKSYSKAVVSFKDDSVLHIGDASQIEVKEYTIGEDGYRKTASIDLDRGEVRAVVAKTADLAPFDIITPNAMGTVKGSDIFVSFHQSATNVLVSEGTFNMIHTDFPDQLVAVEKGMTTLVPYNAPPKDPRAFLPVEKINFEEMTGSIIQNIEGVDPNAEFTKAMVADVTGVVRVQPRGTQKWHAPVKSEVLNTGDKIETGKNGNIKLSFDNGLKIELRPNTQLIITQLTRDPKTGDYNNEFESGYGKLVAQLQNMPAKSSFKVKTPHACCGIRGTIMYLDILPNMTRTFFEGGSGFVDDLINGGSTIIKEGITFTLDGQGNSSENGTTDEDRAGFGSQFGSDGGNVYGYTGDAPDVGGTETGGTETGGTNGIPQDPVDNTPFDDVKLTPPGGSTSPVPMVGIMGQTGREGGTFGEYDPVEGFLSDEESSLTAELVTESTSPVWSGQQGAVITGEYDNPNDKDLFFTDIEGTGDDGGRFFGGLAGTAYGQEQWAGAFSAIYIDGTGVAGNIFGLFPGTHDESRTGEYSSIGETTFIPITYLGDIESEIVFSDSDGENNLYLGFPERKNGLYLNINGQIDIANINGQNWGIWRAILGGTYNGSGEDPSWPQFTGDSVSPEPGNEKYSFTTIEGVDDLESFLRLDITINTIDHYNRSAMYGTLIGVYDAEQDGYYETIGVGGWQTEPLTFVSPVSPVMGSSYYGFTTENVLTFGAFDRTGDDGDSSYSLYGLLGSSDCLWEGSPAGVLFRGVYYTDSELYGSDIYLWGAELNSHNYKNGLGTTYDGGAYRGHIAGYVKNPAASVFGAIYVNPYNETGYITGKLTGETYPDISMFQMTGDTEITPMEYYAESGLTPENIDDYMESGFISGYGCTENMWGEIIDLGNTLELRDAGWGIWEALFQGDYYSGDLSAWKLPILGDIYDNEFYRNGIYIGMIKGNKWVANEHMDAAFRGIWISWNNDRELLQGQSAGPIIPDMSIGTLSGEIVMNNEGEWVDVDGTDEFQTNWSGAGAGEWVEVEDLIDMTSMVNEVSELMSDLNDVMDTVASDSLVMMAGQEGHILTAGMDIDLYSFENANIWMALINGTYDTNAEVTQGDWGVSLEGENSAIDLQGVNWTENMWSADVAGEVDGNSISGTAAGTYDNAGNFQGAGAGVWGED